MIQLIKDKRTVGIGFFNFIFICLTLREELLINQISFMFKIWKFEIAFSLGKGTKNAKAIKKSVKEAIQNSKDNVAST